MYWEYALENLLICVCKLKVRRFGFWKTGLEKIVFLRALVNKLEILFSSMNLWHVPIEDSDVDVNYVSVISIVLMLPAIHVKNFYNY